MCNACGCGGDEVRMEGRRASAGALPAIDHRSPVHPAAGRGDAPSGMHAHGHPDGPRDERVIHDHAHHETGHVAGDLHFGQGPAHAHAPGMSQQRMIEIEQDVLAVNDRHAEGNRRWFADHGVFALNLVSSPGSGKTTLLVHTLEALKGQLRVAVIEGDQQTTRDAERIRATGIPALQINTGKGCHLDAHMLAHAIERLRVEDDSLLMIENVGNLVCPAGFDLGEAHKVVVLSVTEGEDKPLKYPNMFDAASLMILNKIDLLPYVDFDVDRCLEHARRVNPRLAVIQLSARTGEGMAQWLDWLRDGMSSAARQRSDSVAALRQRVAQLEAALAAVQSRQAD